MAHGPCTRSERARSAHTRLFCIAAESAQARLCRPAPAPAISNDGAPPRSGVPVGGVSADGVIRRAAVFSRDHGSCFPCPARDLVRRVRAGAPARRTRGMEKPVRPQHRQKRGAVLFGGSPLREDGATSLILSSVPANRTARPAHTGNRARGNP